VSDTAGNAFPGVARHAMTTASSDAGTVRVGWIGLTMNPEQTPFARFADPIETARTQAAVLHDSVDVLIALTHLTLAQDIALAESVPPIFMILGGHDHENLQLRRGEDLTPILKADANVRTVWVHELRWYPRTRSLAVDSRLVPITDSLPDDPETAAAAAHWVDAAFAAFRAAGFEPAEVVAHVPVELDGLESVVRNRSTALTQLIVDAMRAEVAGAHAALVNSGSIRIDDVLAPGPLTQYDVIRILPFGGPVVEVEMSGALLARVLDQGLLNRGSGGFLQLSNIERVQSSWHVAGTPLDARQSYRIGLSDFLLTGRERGLAFLHRDNPELTVVREHRDVRLAFIAEVRRRWQ
jgi:5'-nucleotidase